MNLLQKLLSRKKRVLSTTTEPVSTKMQSQGYVLQTRMEHANIKHGEMVEANLNHVRIERTDEQGDRSKTGDLTLFFCPMEPVEVLERLKPGDYGLIPREVKLHNLALPTDFVPGVYNMKNILLFANGTINVMATKNTKLELVEY